MTRFVFFCAIILVGFWSVSSSQFVIKVLEKNSTDNGEVIEEVTFQSKPKTKQALPSGVVKVTFGENNPITKPKQKQTKKKRRRQHLRRRCCVVGDLAGKNGFSCLISRNWSRFFLNQTSRTLMKIKIPKNDQGTMRSRFRSKRQYHIYRKINKCVTQQMKSAVQKCCLAYVARERAGKQG